MSGARGRRNAGPRSIRYEEVASVAHLYTREGLTVAQIGERLHFSESAVLRRLELGKVPRRPRGRRATASA